ncbi:MAG: ABC transporter permease subunit [Treponema sp.]|nr:ABC transporter permease subunit [Treponema sp.]
MLRYIIKRLIGMLPTLCLITIFVFFFVRMLPGDPARMLAGPDATLEDVENTRRNLGLDKPVLVQFFNYIGGVLQGDFGISLRTKRPVSAELGMRFRNTFSLALAAIAWSSFLGITVGIWSARHRSKWQDYAGMTWAVSGISMPNFWIGFILIMIFSVRLRWLPTTGAGSFRNLILPAVTLGTNIFAVIARFTRSSLLEVLKADYIRTARAKGVPERLVIWRHGFRNSMISVITVLGLQFGFLLGGSVVVEIVFAYPGLGSLLVESVSYRDYPAIQTLVLIFAFTFIVVNLIVDVLYAVINPEIRLG